MIGEKILKYRKVSFGLSLLLVGLSLLHVAIKGVSLGVDFTGGTLVELKTSEAANIDVFNRKLLSYVKKVDPGLSLSCQSLAEGVVTIRFSSGNYDGGVETIKGAIRSALSGVPFTFERVEDIGPQMSKETVTRSFMAILFAFIAITGYMCLRFNLYFAIAGVLVLVQDVIVSFGMISFFRIDFDLTLMAAFLTIVGYCINDTVVIYDRIRYNLIHASDKSVIHAVTVGIQQTIARSIITSFVTLLAVLGILCFHSESIRNFGIVVGFGIVMGTIGSIFIASVLPFSLGLKPYPVKIKQPIDPLFYAS